MCGTVALNVNQTGVLLALGLMTAQLEISFLFCHVESVLKTLM